MGPSPKIALQPYYAGKVSRVKFHLPHAAGRWGRESLDRNAQWPGRRGGLWVGQCGERCLAGARDSGQAGGVDSGRDRAARGVGQEPWIVAGWCSEWWPSPQDRPMLASGLDKGLDMTDVV